MARKIEFANLGDLVGRYQSGESEKAIAESIGIGRPTLRRFLVRQGVQPRGRSESMFARMSRTPPDERRALVRAANRAAKGRIVGVSSKIKRAATRELMQCGVHASQGEFAAFLSVSCQQLAVCEKAVGPYNVDIGIGPIAVEIYGGGWHGYGRHRERSAERFRYLFDHGWRVVIIWTDERYYPLGRGAAEYVIALLDRLRCDPATPGQYWVIRGDGYELAAGSSNLDDLTAIPTRRRSAQT
jgi:hypothetical protein